MTDYDINLITAITSIVSIFIATYTCYQSSKTNKLINRSHIYMYLISSNKATYIKVKNFGKSNAIILNFETDVDIEMSKKSDKYPFPLVGLENISISPNTSKIAMIDHKYLNCGHWIKVTYFDELTKKQFTHKIELNTYQEFALINAEDFNLVDY